MKYEFTLDLENKNSAHTQCLSLIAPNTGVLDLGCATGILGEYLAKYKNCRVWGCDIIDEFIEISRQKGVYKEVRKLNLDTLTNELDNFNVFFDYILMADVIEHTSNPAEVLNKLKKLLKPEGKFIMSIPNIAHGSIKLSLLADVFRYTEMGLLDKTHLRFFTRENIINLMDECNLQILEQSFVRYLPWDVVYEPKNLIKYPYSVKKMIKDDPYSYIYQFVFSAKPSENVDNKEKLLCGREIVNEAKKQNKQKIVNFIKRHPLFLFRKDFWNMI